MENRSPPIPALCPMELTVSYSSKKPHPLAFSSPVPRSSHIQARQKLALGQASTSVHLVWHFKSIFVKKLVDFSNT